MGRRGPKPLSDAALRARGSDWWRTRRTAAPAPSLPAEAPERPEDLPEEARAEWDRTVSHLLAAGALSPVDRGVLAAYCHTWAAYCELERQVREEGWVYEKPQSGEQARTAASRAMESMLDRFTKLARELGLTPSSRSGLRGLPQAPGTKDRPPEKPPREDRYDPREDRHDLRKGPPRKQRERAAADGPGRGAQGGE